MRPSHVPDEELTPGDVPDPTAPWEQVVAFGHTFHAYRVAGSVGRVSALAAEDAERWRSQDGALPDDLTRLRLDLFATVRSLQSGETPADDTERWARALVEAIRTRIRERG